MKNHLTTWQQLGDTIGYHRDTVRGWCRKGLMADLIEEGSLTFDHRRIPSVPKRAWVAWVKGLDDRFKEAAEARQVARAGGKS